MDKDEADFREVVKLAFADHENVIKAKRSPLIRALAQGPETKKNVAALYEGLRTGKSKLTVCRLHISVVLYEDQFVWDVINRLFDEHMLADNPIPLPEPLKRLWLDIRYGILKPPRKKKGRPSTYDRDRLILMLLEFARRECKGLIHTHFKETRINNQDNPNWKPSSAVDIVAKAFGMKYRTVEGIWESRLNPKSPLFDFYKRAQAELPNTQ